MTKDICNYFKIDFKKLPDGTFIEERLIDETDSHIKRKFCKQLEIIECGIFNRIVVNFYYGGGKSVIYENNNLNSISIESVHKLIDDLYCVLGEDFFKRGMFVIEDKEYFYSEDDYGKFGRNWSKYNLSVNLCIDRESNKIYLNIYNQRGLAPINNCAHISTSISELEYDSTGVQTLSSGVKILSMKLNSDIKTIGHAIYFLGYCNDELYFIRKGIDTDVGVFVGLCKIISGDLVCIIRTDENIMTQDDVRSYYQRNYEKKEDWELESQLDYGIENGSIRKSFIESVLNKTATDNSITGAGYIFRFEDDYLSEYLPEDEYSTALEDSLLYAFELYYIPAKQFYRGDEEAAKKEFNLQVVSKQSIPLNILESKNTIDQFSYPDGVVNYIAIAAYYRTIDIELDVFLKSTHGRYEIIPSHISHNTQETEVKAYGKIYKFKN